MSVYELFNSHTTLWYKIVNISVSQRREPRHREVAVRAQVPRAGIQAAEAWPHGQCVEGCMGAPIIVSPG